MTPRRRLAQIVSRIFAGIFLTVLNACAVAKQHVGLMVFGALRGLVLKIQCVSNSHYRLGQSLRVFHAFESKGFSIAVV